MATWDDQDLNHPELYIPRPHPKVRQAPVQIRNQAGEFALPVSLYARAMDASPGGNSPIRGEPSQDPAVGGDYIFDEDLDWNTALGLIPQHDEAPSSPAQGKSSSPPPKSKKPTDGSGKSKGKNERDKSPQGTGFFASPYWYVGLITLCLAALAFVVVMMMPQMAGYFWRDVGNYAFVNGEILRFDKQIASNYRQSREYLQQQVIYPGVFVDGIHVGGMTVEEAQAVLVGPQSAQENLFSVGVAIGNKTWTFDNSNVPATRDVGNVLQQAYAVGRTNTTATLGTQITPFRERLNTVMALRESGVNLNAKAAYDRERVRTLVDEIVNAVNRPPQDAALRSIDIATHTLLFTDEQVGVAVDGEELYRKVTASLDRWEKGTVITVEPVLTQPKVTKAQLTANFQRISAYTTDTTKDGNRNNNINLACQAITSTVLMPGETFSFNQATGQRTIEKGYREAGAISAGQSIDEVGGGICQVSSTLFNAVARADLEIVSRSPHAWPVTYVNKGEDATVNWPNLDFQFRNNKSTPVYIVAYYQNRKCSAEIWGFPLGENVTIDLRSKVVKTIEPPLDVRYVINPNMAPGTSKETIKSRTGYVVDTYKVWYQNGTEVKREKFHTSTYKAYQRTIEYN